MTDKNRPEKPLKKHRERRSHSQIACEERRSPQHSRPGFSPARHEHRL